MKIFLSALENSPVSKDDKAGGFTSVAKYMVEHGIKMKWNLMSYYYIRKNRNLANYIKQHSELIMIDSGAHSFHQGKKENWEQYTREYAQFIKEFDDEKVVGFFEMDIDGQIGYDNVLKLRHILEQASNKIIPVWHKNRGIEEYKKMCRDYAGKVIAISGFANEDITDAQYISFLKYARQYGCKVHCLGMTRQKILSKVPFDYTDSSSWSQSGIFGKIDGKGKVTKEYGKSNRCLIWTENYKNAMKMQAHYYQKWKKECKD